MSGTIQSIGGGSGSTSTPDAEYQILCDDNGSFLRRIVRDSGGVITVADTTLDGVTAYTVVGIAKQCQESPVTLYTECYLANFDGVGYTAGDRILHLVRFDISAAPSVLDSIWYNATTSVNLAGVPVADDLRDCDLAVTASEFCYQATATNTDYDLGDTLRYVRFYDASNRAAIAFAGELWWNATRGTPVNNNDPFALSEIKECKVNPDDYEIVTLCDDNGLFLRHIARNAAGVATVTNTLLDGTTPYTVVGTVKRCTDSTYTESLICAEDVTMIRRVDNAGNVTFISTDGATVAAPSAYTIGACAADLTKPCVTCRS